MSSGGARGGGGYTTSGNSGGSSRNLVMNGHGHNHDENNHTGNANNTNNNVKVYLRLRPTNKLEASRRSRNCVEVHDDGTTLTVDSPLEGEYDFKFDGVFDKDASQKSVYDHVGHPIASDFVRGYNCCIIAYGQSGSGKTHTMMGVGGDDLTTTVISGGNNTTNNHSSDASTKRDGADSLQPSHTVSGIEEGSGMIIRIVHDIFQLLKTSPPEMEYTIRCSYAELYMEKLWDLLDPSATRSLSVVDNDETHENGSGNGNASSSATFTNDRAVNVLNLSEACCVDESDVISLLVRGNACRSMAAAKLNTDPSRSHAVFLLHLDQVNELTGETTRGTLSLYDLAGSEYGAKPQSRQSAAAQGQNNIAETKMIYRSFSALHQVVRMLSGRRSNSLDHDAGASEDSGDREAPYRNSKLTKLLRQSFGGNCLTSVLVTASSSSYNIHETLNSIRFGQRARRIVNRKAKVNVMQSATYYKRLLEREESKRREMTFLLGRVRRELARDGGGPHSKGEQHGGRFNLASPLFESIDTVLAESKDMVPHSRGTTLTGNRSEEETLAALREELDLIAEQRDQAENAYSEVQSEVALLRTQHKNDEEKNKKQTAAVTAAANETQLLGQKASELDLKLRTSMFRESEATVFLRQFRRFYRRLLRHKAAQGSGEVPDVIAKVPGVPDLSDLIDVDTLLVEAGLIEENEMYDDSSVSSFQPSQKALTLSHKAAKKAARRDGSSMSSLGKNASEGDGLPPSGRKKAGEDGASKSSNYAGESEESETESRHSEAESSVTQSLQQNPGGMNASEREQTLQKDLTSVTEKCIELQIALDEEKSKVEALTNRAGTLNKKRLAQDVITLKESLDKKTHDLQAIIWKMNELHLINKTYSEKMANRDQHVAFLEDTLQDLQEQNRKLLANKQDSEGKLQHDLDQLQGRVDAMTVPLWQYGECEGTGRTVTNRIYVPFRGERSYEAMPHSHEGVNASPKCVPLPVSAAPRFEPPNSYRDESGGNAEGPEYGEVRNLEDGSAADSSPKGLSGKDAAGTGNTGRGDEHSGRQSPELNVPSGYPMVPDVAEASVISEDSSLARSLAKRASKNAKSSRVQEEGESSFTSRGEDDGQRGESKKKQLPEGEAADAPGSASDGKQTTTVGEDDGEDQGSAEVACQSVPEELEDFDLEKEEGMDIPNVLPPPPPLLHPPLEPMDPMDLDQPLPCMEGMELAIPADGFDEVVSVMTSNFNEQYVGGKPQSFVPRRFAPKKGLNIRAGVVKSARGLPGKRSPG